MSSTLPRLTSLSNQTLTLLLERQRLQSLSGFTKSTIALPSSSLSQIMRNLSQLRTGLQDLEQQRPNGSTGTDDETTRLLRAQYGRMRDMMGTEKEITEP